ncbi:MAG: polyprenyl synthetase family protein [Lachnospiraceae bacterium]|nr:polyprenyl synthetase family protein [Lachnospiraceae bacterium]
MIGLNTIEELLEQYLPKGDEGYGLLSEAMRYSVLGGGKRLRAIMLIESFRLFSDDKDLEKCMAYPFACALECIHGYSLVHDDLPAMDNDEFRRGSLTTHKRYGHAMGILTGDALLNYSMEMITRAGVDFEKSKLGQYCSYMSRFMRAASVLYKNAGAFGMIGGQVLDVEGFGDDVQPDEGMLATLCELKTSRLFQAALCCGAILAGADETEVSFLDDIGRLMGLAFQIRDDILDVTASFDETGKDTGSDEKNNKSTFVSMFGLDAARDRVKELYGEMSGKLEALPGDKTALESLFKKLFMI